jgi:hypothetical protein
MEQRLCLGYISWTVQERLGGANRLSTHNTIRNDIELSWVNATGIINTESQTFINIKKSTFVNVDKCLRFLSHLTFGLL